MINKWVLDNFKSINREKELNFRPLTIFTGANSSGKSTILQSILLVTQTLQDQIESRSIVLNGWFKKFGSYSDIVFHRDDSRNIKIGFEISDADNMDVDDFQVVFYEDEIERAECEFVIASDGKEDCLLPVLERMQLKASLNGETTPKEIILSRNPERTSVDKIVIEQCKDKYGEVDFSYNLNNLSKLRYSFYDSKVEYKPLGCSLSHFLPNNIVAYISKKDFYKKSIQEYLLMGSYLKLHINDEDGKMLVSLLQETALAIAEKIKKDEKYRNERAFNTCYNKMVEEFSLEKLQSLFRITTLDGKEKNDYVKQLQKRIEDMPEGYITQRRPMFYYHPGPAFVKNFFSRRIKYLGPLREEPKSLYALETSNTPMELGLKGENTAAVYENNKDCIIQYIAPSFFMHGAQGNVVESTGTLAEAVAEWLVYLGVAKQITTNDRGKMGHELKITNELNDMQQDLTHVGVGVSQVLPILVMSFLANKGDVIILEQPELHLHPKVQTRLADFFVTMTQLGKQCLIETHSEYFINRLRYRVAVADDNQIAKNTMIYFVEKDKKEGYSKYREVTINEYGVIEDWPEGFFDESERIAAEILRAGMRKKMQEEEYEE